MVCISFPVFHFPAIYNYFSLQRSLNLDYKKSSDRFYWAKKTLCFELKSECLEVEKEFFNYPATVQCLHPGEFAPLFLWPLEALECLIIALKGGSGCLLRVLC